MIRWLQYWLQGVGWPPRRRPWLAIWLGNRLSDLRFYVWCLRRSERALSAEAEVLDLRQRLAAYMPAQAAEEMFSSESGVTGGHGPGSPVSGSTPADNTAPDSDSPSRRRIAGGEFDGEAEDNVAPLKFRRLRSVMERGESA